MSGVTKNGVTPGNQLWKRTDGRFSALAERRSNHHTFRVRAWFTGQSQATENHPTADLAIEAAKALWSDYEHGRLAFEPPPETLAALVARYEQRTDVTARHLKSWASQVCVPVRAIGVDSRLDRLSTYVVQEALTARQWSAGTWNLSLVRLGQMFGWAVDRGWMDSDPTSRIGRREDPRSILPWLAYRDWPALLEAEPDERWRLRMAFALETGMRIGELAHAQASWLELRTARPVIQVQRVGDWQPKTRRSNRAIPLSAKACALAEQALAWWPAEDGPLLGRFRFTTFRAHIAAACAKAGLPHVTPHGLRRSTGARWLEAGVPLVVVSRWMGHGSVSVTEQCYAGISESLQAAAVDKVDAHAQAWQSGAVVPLRRHDKQRDKAQGGA